MAEKEIVAGDWVAPDQAAVQLDAHEKGNPRLKVNVPADKLFIEVTDSQPPYLVVVVRADNLISAKGALSHAHDLYLAYEAKATTRAALSLGVKEAGKILAAGGKA